jgi:hypothetical protein
MHEPVFNFYTRRVGGLRFVWLGRFVFSFCVRREMRDPGRAGIVNQMIDQGKDMEMLSNDTKAPRAADPSPDRVTFLQH